MKTYNVSLKKNGQLLVSFTVYDKKMEKDLLKAFKKLQRYCNIQEVTRGGK